MSRSRFTAVTSLICVLIFAFAAPFQMQGQHHGDGGQHPRDNKDPYPTMAPLDQYLMADRNAEIALARTAAPSSISQDATVMILTSHGFETGAEGKNGFVCIVVRGWTSPRGSVEFWNPKNRSPICYNPEAQRTVLPYTYMRTKLALEGKSKDEILDGIKAAVEKKELPALEPGAMCYMTSKHAYLTDKGITQDGAHTVAHMMFYTPRINPADWGANMENSPIVVDPRAKSDPEPFNIFIMFAGSWSDGSPAPLN